MAVFLVKSSVGEVSTAVAESLDSQGFELTQELDFRSRSPIWAISARCLEKGVEGYARITSHEEGVTVDMTLRRVLFHRLVILVPLVCFDTVAILLVLFLHECAIAFRVLVESLVAWTLVVPVSAHADRRFLYPPTCCWTPCLIFIIAFASWQCTSRLEWESVSILSSFENHLWTLLRKKYSTRLLALPKTRAVSRVFSLGHTIVLFVAVIILISRIYAPALMWSLPFLAFFFLTPAVSTMYDSRPELYPRVLCQRMVINVILLKSLVLLLPMLGIGLTAAHQIKQALEDKNLPMSLEAVQDCVATGVVELDRISSGRERLAQLDGEMEPLVRSIAAKVPGIDKYQGYVEGVILAVPACGIAAALFIAIHYGVAVVWRTLSRIPAVWRMTTLQYRIRWMRLPATVESRKICGISFRLLVIVFFLCGVPINLLSLVAAIDAAAFAVGGQAVFLPQIQSALTWVFVPFLVGERLTGVGDVWLWHVLACSVILLFALPSLISFAFRILTSCVNIAWRFASVLSTSFRRCHGLNVAVDCTKQLSLRCGVKYPRILVTRGRAIRFSVVPALFGWRPILCISRGALSNLSQDELRAAVAHELGHIRHGLRKVALLRALSSLGGFPPWFLPLMLDFRSMEEEADRFALCAGAGPHALSQTLIKASANVQAEGFVAAFTRGLGQRLPERLTKRSSQTATSLRILYDFLFTSELTSCLHPPLLDRLKTIQRDAARSDDLWGKYGESGD